MSEYAKYEPTRPKSSGSLKQAVLVRPASIDDSGALAEILARREGTTDVGARKERFERLVSEPDELVLVAEVPGEVVGFGRAANHKGSTGCPPGWYLVGLVVTPQKRRWGIGSLLTERRLDWIAERANEAFYFANEGNLATIDMHRAVGFVELTRNFSFPEVTFERGRGILFRIDLSSRKR